MCKGTALTKSKKNFIQKQSKTLMTMYLHIFHGTYTYLCKCMLVRAFLKTLLLFLIFLFPFLFLFCFLFCFLHRSTPRPTLKPFTSCFDCYLKKSTTWTQHTGALHIRTINTTPSWYSSKHHRRQEQHQQQHQLRMTTHSIARAFCYGVVYSYLVYCIGCMNLFFFFT